MLQTTGGEGWRLPRTRNHEMALISHLLSCKKGCKKVQQTADGCTLLSAAAAAAAAEMWEERPSNDMLILLERWPRRTGLKKRKLLQLM